MWKVVGCVCFLGGAAGVLYSWVLEQREKEKQLEEFVHFLQKSLASMQTENIRLKDYFLKYTELYLEASGDSVLAVALKEISEKLAQNTYPNGQMVWTEVFQEDVWKFDKEINAVIVQAGNGFFGRSRLENVAFLEKSIRDLEIQQRKIKERNVQKRKVWIPVGMLGSIMLVIIFI